ncbi:MAG: LysM peptidoglycan-binding domain-containing protein [Eubacteriales bacterium]|nr:LysM peptidoglycan-binding domain-containing protein [Eubacteriales bacterium]
MAYSVYLGNILLPVTPEAIQVKVKGRNETVVLMDQGEVNILKSPGLTELSFDALLPNIRYPWAIYPGGFRRAEYYLSALEQLKLSGVFLLVISRQLPVGTGLYGTSMKVSLEDYTTKEDAGQQGFDVLASLTLKQFRDYGTKTCQISGNTALILPVREAATAPSQTSYTVQEGESLWEISKRCYGDGSRYQELQAANNIADPNNPPAGQTITIPR